jgi:hypothetical protein
MAGTGSPEFLVVLAIIALIIAAIGYSSQNFAKWLWNILGRGEGD